MMNLRYPDKALLPRDVDRAVYVFLRWLECEQSAISQYLDRYPSIRDSFLAAVQQVAGHGLLLTPAATPAEDLDNKPAEPASEIVDWTGTVNHDGGDQALVVTAVGPTVVDGTVSISAVNNERVDYCLPKPLDKSIEGGDGEDQPQTLVALDNVSALDVDLSERNTEKPLPPLTPHCKWLKFTLPETLYISSRVHPTPEQTIDESVSLPLAGETEALSKLSPKTLDKFQRIADPETLATLWYYLRAQRYSPPNEQPRATSQTADPLDTSIEGRLSEYRLQYKNMRTSNKYFIELPPRLYFAKIAGLYMETSARKHTSPRKKRRRTNRDDGIDATNTSLNNTFVNFLLPQLQSGGETRKNPKRRFENWRQIGRACTKLVESFGVGILLLLPRELWDENLRELTVPQEDALIAYLDSSRPCLKTDIKNLSFFLSALIKDRCLPKRTMMLEVLTESQITSGELEIRSLRELLWYSDDVNYTSYLTDGALSELSQTDSDASPHHPVDHQPGSCVNLPSLGSSDDHDPGSILYTDYLLSPTDGKEMDRFDEDYFLF